MDIKAEGQRIKIDAQRMATAFRRLAREFECDGDEGTADAVRDVLKTCTELQLATLYRIIKDA